LSVPARPHARPYGVRVEGSALRRELDIRGVTAADVARRAKVAASTVSQALNGRRIHPRKLQAIAAALAAIQPLPELVKLLGGSERDKQADA
jgi:transcriptional regulator with XRE-family HTH domain